MASKGWKEWTTVVAKLSAEEGDAPASKGGFMAWVSGIFAPAQRPEPAPEAPEAPVATPLHHIPPDEPAPGAAVTHEPVDAALREAVREYRQEGNVVALEKELCGLLADRFFGGSAPAERDRACEEALSGLAKEGAIQRFSVGDDPMCYLKFK